MPSTPRCTRRLVPGCTSCWSRRTAPWPSPIPTPSSWPTSSWPRAVASREPGAGPLVSIDGARAEAGPGVHLVGVIGSPISHSLSPLLHNAAFAALGLDATWHSQAFEVAAGEAASALGAMRRAGVSGLSVTMPHKADVAGLVDECSDVAQRL